MKIKLLNEPMLEFGNGNTWPCPKEGIRRFMPYDMGLVRPETIKVGIIGISESVETIIEWLKRGSTYIEAKKSNQPKLFPAFMGFQEQNGFCSKLVYDESYIRKIRNSEFQEIYKSANEGEIVQKAADLYLADIRFLSKNKSPDVIICVIPESFVQHFAPKAVKEGMDEAEAEDFDKLEEEEHEPEEEHDFRRLLKARAMEHHIPIQIVRDRIATPSGEMQDEATIAWNFFTALYYKAAGTPWSLVKPATSVVSFAGISFYKSRDRATTQTSIAQIFNELGKGVILRGEDPIDVKKFDPIPHLSEEQAFNLMDRALFEYKEAVDLFPQRLVIHKTSNFTPGEIEGFTRAAQKYNIGGLDLITIHHGTGLRLFRQERYPPLRGTMFSFDDRNHLLYTRGSVPYFETYPGKYIPNPLQLRIYKNDESPETICNEILGLTKMNWNNTQFDRRLPITIECARKVGDILKYIPLEEKSIEVRYSFYT
jgi:argonaute-like protein implicated in RNA metabolism and viral defense